MKLLARLFAKSLLVKQEQIDKADTSNYYEYIATCQNCNDTKLFYIKKGLRVNDVIEHVICDNCGCRLEKKESK